MKKEYEIEKCECGHIAPIIFISYDDDGNGTCPNCMIEELAERLKKPDINSLPDFMDISHKKDVGDELTAIELFIYQNEPASLKQANEFRKGLIDVINIKYES